MAFVLKVQKGQSLHNVLSHAPTGETDHILGTALYAKTAGGAWVPVTVESDGSLVAKVAGEVDISDDVTRKLGEVTLTGSGVPLPVTIDGIGDAGGALPVKEAPISTFRPRQVDATSESIRLDTTPLAGRRYVDISLVEDDTTGYIGNADLVGAENGIPITNTDGWRLYVQDTVPIYGVGGTFLIVEVA